MRKNDIRGLLRSNAVTVMFVLLCAVCMVYSRQPVSYVIYELFGRLSRNAFLVLALIIPIIAGMGINFAVTIGAMAAQIAALWVIEWGVSGIGGFSLALLMTVPIAAFFGYLIGKLMNKMKGQEMIGSLILGYFANGLYQLLFLFVFGNLIPLNAPGLVIKGSTGVANTIDLSTERGFKYALDGIWRISFGPALYICCAAIALGVLALILFKRVDKKKGFISIGALDSIALSGTQADVPALPDSRGCGAVFHGTGSHGYVYCGRRVVPVQCGNYENPHWPAVPCGGSEPHRRKRVGYQRGPRAHHRNHDFHGTCGLGTADFCAKHGFLPNLRRA